MPQITCPNCGMTINLENRKRIDFNLIADAAKKQPKTFTELLHITKLSRKTLSLRLKELCEKGTLVKDAGMYRLNGPSEYENNGKNLAKGFLRVSHDKRIGKGLMLIAFLLCSSASGYVLAAFIAPKETYQQPVITGNFTIALDVNNVKDLYAWQVIITFNSSELKVMKITLGGFVGDDFPFFLNATDVGGDTLFLGGSLCGDISGKNGSGRLATILFGYFADGYEEPRIASGEKWCFNNVLLNSHGFIIPLENSTTVTLATIENCEA